MRAYGVSSYFQLRNVCDDIKKSFLSIQFDLRMRSGVYRYDDLKCNLITYEIKIFDLILLYVVSEESSPKSKELNLMRY